MMPQPLHNQELASPASRSVTSITQVENMGEDLPKPATHRDNRGDAKKVTRTYDQENIETALSTPPNRGHDVLSTAAAMKVTETQKRHTLGSSAKTSFELASGIHKVEHSNEHIHKAHTNASTNRGGSTPERSSNTQFFGTSKSPVGTLETSNNVTAGSPLQNMTEEDRLKWGEGEGIDINDLLSHINKSVSKDDTEETVSNNTTVDNFMNKLPIHKRCTSSNVFGDQIEDVGGMDANDGLQPWTQNPSGITGGPSAMDTTHSSEEYLRTSSVQLSGGPAGSSGIENMTKEDRLQWGQGEGIKMNDLVSHFDKAFSEDDAEETVSDKKTPHDGIDKFPIHGRCTSSNMLCDQSVDVGGMDANHGLQPWTKNTPKVTRGPSAKNTSYSNVDPLSTLSVQLSGLSPTPPPRGSVNLLRPVSLSAVGHPVTTGDSIPSDAPPAIQVGSVAVAEKHRNTSIDDIEKWDTDADFSLNDGAREMTDEDRIRLGLHDGWPYKLSDANTGLPPMTEESWQELETKKTSRRFASDGPSEIDTGRVTAENPSAGTRPLPSIPANVSSLRNLELDEPFKLFDPPEPKTMQQEVATPDVVEPSGYNSAQLSAVPFHAANSKTGTHSVVDTAVHLTGVPEMYDTASPMKGTTKDMPADFGLQKWTGDDSVDQDTKYAKLVSSDSERPESSLESRDFMLWTACYPDDPDKARELEASTGVPGIRVYPVDVFFRATSSPQVSNEVDASQKSANSRKEMETQARRLSNE